MKIFNHYEKVKFGEAIEAARSGKRIQRSGWNGKGLFVFCQVPAQISIDVVPKMQSLPESVREEFIRRGVDIHYSNQWAIVNLNNEINGWTPSSSDALAEDWQILD